MSRGGGLAKVKKEHQTVIAPDLIGHFPTFGHNQKVFVTVVQGLCNLAVHAAIRTHAHVVVQTHVDVDYAYMPRSVCAVGASTPSFGSSVEDTEGRHSASRPVQRPCHAIHSAASYGPVDQHSAVGLKGCTPAFEVCIVADAGLALGGDCDKGLFLKWLLSAF